MQFRYAAAQHGLYAVYSTAPTREPLYYLYTSILQSLQLFISSPSIGFKFRMISAPLERSTLLPNYPRKFHWLVHQLSWLCGFLRWSPSSLESYFRSSWLTWLLYEFAPIIPSDTPVVSRSSTTTMTVIGCLFKTIRIVWAQASWLAH